MIKGVVFDFGGVLFGSPLTHISDLEQQIGARPAQLSTLLARSSETGAWGSFERGEIGLERFERDMNAELAEASLETSAVELLKGASGKYNEALIRYIADDLKGRFKLAIITNNFQIASHQEPLEKIRDYFDVVVESSKVGYRKPEPIIYDITFSRLKLAPDEIVYIDDIGSNLRYPASRGALTIKANTFSEVQRTLREVLIADQHTDN